MASFPRLSCETRLLAASPLADLLAGIAINAHHFGILYHYLDDYRVSEIEVVTGQIRVLVRGSQNGGPIERGTQFIASIIDRSERPDDFRTLKQAIAEEGTRALIDRIDAFIRNVEVPLAWRQAREEKRERDARYERLKDRMRGWRFHQQGDRTRARFGSQDRQIALAGMRSLGASLSEDASMEEIKAEYKRLAKAFFPDLGPANERDWRNEQMAKLNNFYDILRSCGDTCRADRIRGLLDHRE